MRTPLLLSSLLVASAVALHAGEMDAITGKWSADREMNGQKVQFVLQLRQDSFDLEIRDSGGEARFFAKGKAKAEKAGQIRTLTLTDIEAGQDRADLQPVNDDRTLVYITGYQTLTVAANLDRERDNDPASLTVYRKVNP